jgi:hypothetical protein
MVLLVLLLAGSWALVLLPGSLVVWRRALLLFSTSGLLRQQGLRCGQPLLHWIQLLLC